MEIEIDYNPTPSDMFFISVPQNDKEAISFDYTTKAHRIIRQVLVANKPLPAGRPVSGEWDALILKDGKFEQKYHVKWIDMGKQDWCNDEIWETREERPISDELAKKLHEFSRLISDNYQNLPAYADKLKNLEDLLTREIAKFYAGK